MKFETIEVTAPACWASYLINGDSSGLDYSGRESHDREVAAADAMVEDIGCGSPVSCSDESEFRHRGDYSADGLAGDFLTYTFLRRLP